MRRITWPFLVIIAVLVALFAFSLDIVSSARAYVNGESLWSKGQKRAAAALERYAVTADAADYAAFRRALAVPLGDRKAREALEAAAPDPALARQGFLEGENHPDDIPGMVRLFRNFRHVSFMDRAIRIWAEGDALVAELDRVGAALHAELSGRADRATVAALVAQARALDARLTPLEDDFSRTLGEASRTVTTLITALSLAAGIGLVSLALLMSRRTLRQAETYEEALRLSAERLRLALTGAHMGTWHWERRQERLEWSETCLALFGLPPGTAMRYEAFLALVHPEDRARVAEAVRQATAAPRAYDVEFRVIWPDGAERWIASRGEAAFDAQGRAIRMEGVALDITARKAAEAALVRANETLEQKVAERTLALSEANVRLRELDRLKSEFLATMSHELRTPLNSIIGFSSLLLQGLPGPLNAEQSKQIGHVLKAGEHLLELINDLLDLSRLEAGHGEIVLEHFDFAAVVNEVLDQLRPFADGKGLSLSARWADGGCTLESDRRKCRQVLSNLVQNAIKFTAEGSVRVEVVEEPDRLVVTVADTGIGIRPEQQPLLFEAFRQLDGSARRSYEGTGLGLHLSRRLLGLLGGEISVQSEPGVGSRFRFALPRTPGPV